MQGHIGDSVSIGLLRAVQGDYNEEEAEEKN